MAKSIIQIVSAGLVLLSAQEFSAPSLAQSNAPVVHEEALKVDFAQVAPLLSGEHRGEELPSSAVLQTGNQSVAAVITSSSTRDISAANLRFLERRRVAGIWEQQQVNFQLTSLCGELSAALPQDAASADIEIGIQQIGLLGPRDPRSAIAQPDDRLAVLVALRYQSMVGGQIEPGALSAILLFRRNFEPLSCSLLIPDSSETAARTSWSKHLATSFAVTGVTATQTAAAVAPEHRRPFLAVAFQPLASPTTKFPQSCVSLGCDPDFAGQVVSFDLVQNQVDLSAVLVPAYVDMATLNETVDPSNFRPQFEFAAPILSYGNQQVEGSQVENFQTLSKILSSDRYDYLPQPPVSPPPAIIPPDPCAQPPRCEQCDLSSVQPRQSVGDQSIGDVARVDCDCGEWIAPSFCAPPTSGTGSIEPPKIPHLESLPRGTPVRPGELPSGGGSLEPVRPEPPRSESEPEIVTPPVVSPPPTEVSIVFGAAFPLYVSLWEPDTEAEILAERLRKLWLQPVTMSPGEPQIWIMLQAGRAGASSDAGTEITVRTLHQRDLTSARISSPYTVLFDTGSFAWAFSQAAPEGATLQLGIPLTYPAVVLAQGASRLHSQGRAELQERVSGVIDTGRILVAPGAGKNLLNSLSFTNDARRCQNPIKSSVAAIPEYPWFPPLLAGGVKAPLTTVGWSCGAQLRGAEWFQFTEASGNLNFQRYCWRLTAPLSSQVFNALLVREEQSSENPLAEMIAASVIQIPTNAMPGQAPELQFLDVGRQQSVEPSSESSEGKVSWTTATGEFVQCGEVLP